MAWRPVYPFHEGQPDPWRRRVDALTGLDPDSQPICDYLRSTLTSPGPLTAILAPLYIVGPEQPLVPVTVQEGYEPFAEYLAEIPIPSGALPSTTGSDHYLFVVQQTPLGQNDRLWELWHASYSDTPTVRWTGGPAVAGWSCTLGICRDRIRTDNPGYSRLVVDVAGHALERPLWGVSGSRLSLGGGVIQIAEWESGVIDHALQMNVAHARQGAWAFPAQWTDGTDTAQYSIPEGAHFRLDPTVDLTTLGLTREMLIFATAVQKYGAVVSDQTGGTVGFVFEDQAQYTAQEGHGFYDHTSWLTPGAPSFYMQQFPWQYMQLLPMDLRTTQDNTSFTEADPVLTYSLGQSTVGGAPVDLGNDPSLQLANGSIEAWFSTATPAPIDNYAALVAKPHAYFLGIDASGNLMAYGYGGARGPKSTGHNVCDGQIHHAVLTFQSGVTNGSVLYLDGQPVLTTTITVQDQTIDAYLGGGSLTGQLWIGSLDGCSILGYVLTPAQVASRFSAGA